VQVRLDYGKTGLMVELPEQNVKAVLGLKHAARIENTEAAISDALNNPIGTQPLAELAQNRKSACVVICDITRPVPNTLLLPPILATIEAAGVPKESISILIATGTHRPNLGEELIELVGSQIAAEYRIVNHYCKEEASHTDLGVSPRGVPVKLDTEYVNADLKITVGLIEPHFMAGYSGGRKLIMPGIASFETVSHWHCPRFLESPLATNGQIRGNPVHEESFAIASLVRPDMIVDVTLDEANQITGVFAGDLKDAWLAGTEFAGLHVVAELKAPADIVVTTCAGSPLDATFYQAVKGMVGAMPAVKPGGEIIIASECREGLGSKEFSDALLEITDLEEFVKYISQPGVFVPEEWEIEELAKVARHASITCITGGIPADTLAKCFVKPAESVEAAVADALKKYGPKASIVVIPRGPYVIPKVI
jgi:lactate racemase